jgi:hypothetical protein
MKHVINSVVVLSVVVALLAAGCVNGSPPAGAACDTSGGVCTSAACEGEALPYPCPGNESCCIPPKEGGPK